MVYNNSLVNLFGNEKERESSNQPSTKEPATKDDVVDHVIFTLLLLIPYNVRSQ